MVLRNVWSLWLQNWWWWSDDHNFYFWFIVPILYYVGNNKNVPTLKAAREMPRSRNNADRKWNMWPKIIVTNPKKKAQQYTGKILLNQKFNFNFDRNKNLMRCPQTLRFAQSHKTSAPFQHILSAFDSPPQRLEKTTVQHNSTQKGQAIYTKCMPKTSDISSKS